MKRAAGRGWLHHDDAMKPAPAEKPAGEKPAKASKPCLSAATASCATLKSWFKRRDLDDSITDFVALAESRMSTDISDLPPMQALGGRDDHARPAHAGAADRLYVAEIWLGPLMSATSMSSSQR